MHLHAYHKEGTKVKALEAKVSRLLKEKAAREQELEEERRRGGKVEQELQELRGREAGEELQMAEVLVLPFCVISFLHSHLAFVSQQRLYSFPSPASCR